MAIYHSTKALIGDTPLLEITHFSLPEGVRLYAKLEFYNPGGSVKDRLGLELINNALSSGKIEPGGTIIEPTAGNTGIGMALAAMNQDLSVIFCVPEQFSIEKQQLMTALGATIVHTPSDQGMAGAIEKTEQLLDDIPNSFSPQQFANPANPYAYYKTIAPELWHDLDGEIDVFVAGAGSGGTFMGTSKYLKEQKPDIRSVIVEPEGSIIAGGEPGSHKTEGIGMEFLPDFFDHSLVDDVYTVTDRDAFSLTAQLAKEEGLLVGSSSGSAMYAALEEARHAKPGTTIVTIFPDGSDRYLSKGIYSDGQ
ncbi:PLP-dependent cysteine synthase family protein [Lentibacillus sp. CBA3610]|uniref:PLP-dependent cysteine synthase family protein n=1 Tax=Lentibacillus sp. CBA3610 TaxID=2518176 RepID=UPI0015963D8C|nr:cysteine synthase family protein [Lentibacillus sp. CBA3610]QKY68482.1 cysteine synthase family protein [Lentibacillus sp. CBA3610]